ncbi:MAG: murein biosynthesis integral membrane protein MurJ [Gammaproteobacteria bacterium]|nr:murein biosynthesis integral membrane protein MurJ [Gammaproteobacteria bacterium]
MRGALLSSLLTVGTNTVASRILGLLRDVVIARTFGAGSGADAFFVAFRIPNFLRRLFAEGAFSQAFVPVLSEYRTTRDLSAVRDLIAHTAGTLSAVLLVLTALGMLAAPAFVAVFAPGFVTGEAGKLALTADMLRITFPYLLFISLAALAGGALNSYERFGVPAFTPVLLNISIISCALFLAPALAQPVTALAWGVCLGGAAQLGFQLPLMAKLGLLARPRLNVGHAGVKRIVKLMAPALFGASVSQINLLIDTLLASFLVTGSVSWLYFSDRLMEFPLGVFGVALGTVILPRLSSEHAQRDPGAFSATLDWALRWGFLIAVPASVGLAVLAGPLLSTLFQYGAFTGADVRMASLSLIAYAIGLTGFVMIKILAPGYFARQDMVTPVRIGLVAMAANLIFNLLLVFTLAHAGLALATALSSMVNAGLLYRGLVSRGIHSPKPGWWRFAAAVGSAAGLMGVGVYWIAGELTVWLNAPFQERVWRLALTVGFGVLTYGGALLLFGLRPSQIRRPD